MLECFAPEFVLWKLSDHLLSSTSMSRGLNCIPSPSYLGVGCHRWGLNCKDRRERGASGSPSPKAYPMPPSASLGTDVTTMPRLHQRPRCGSRIPASEWIESLGQAARLEQNRSENAGWLRCLNYQAPWAQKDCSPKTSAFWLSLSSIQK